MNVVIRVEWKCILKCCQIILKERLVKKKKREGELVSKLGYSFPQNERKNGDQDCSCGKEMLLNV